MDGWENAWRGLEAWHKGRSRLQAQSALAFLKRSLQGRFPRRLSWDEEQRREVLQAFLSRLLTRSLPTRPDDPRAYLTRMFSNFCVDHQQRLNRDRRTQTEAFTQLPLDESIDVVSELQARRTVYADLPMAWGGLSVEDRVCLKLACLPPDSLTDDEVQWLCDCGGEDSARVWGVLRQEPDRWALTLLFDPPGEEEDLSDAAARRRRMERFRKRVTRARKRLERGLEETP